MGVDNVKGVKKESAIVSLTLEEQVIFKQSAVNMHVKPGHIIFQEEESSLAVYLIGEGHVKISRASNIGTTVIMGIRQSGDVIGIAESLSGINRCCYAEAIEKSELWKMNTQAFLRFMHRYPDLAIKVTTALGARLREAETTIFNLVTLEVDRRLARLLLDLARKSPSQGQKGVKINIQLTQQDLSTMIGTCRQTVTSTLQKFKIKGLIHTGKKSIEILDVSGLESFANS